MKTVSCVGYGKLGKLVANALEKADLGVQIVDTNAAVAPVVFSSLSDAPTADVILLTLPGYAAIKAVVDACPTSIMQGKTVLCLSTLTIDQSKELLPLVESKGAELIVGAVICHRDAVGTPASYIVYSGKEAAYAAIKPIVDALQGAHNAGENIIGAPLMDYTASGVHYSYVLAFYTGVAMCRKYGLPMKTYLYHTLKSLPPLAEAAKRNIFIGLDDQSSFEEVDDVIHGMEMLVCLLKKSGAKAEIRDNEPRLKKINHALYQHWNDIMSVYAKQD